jgi:inner membrane protein
MPSPVAHSLIGLALGAAWLLPRAPRRELGARVWTARGSLAAAVFAANAPDLDYVPGLLSGDLNAFHPGITHTVPFVLGLAAAMALCRRAGRARAFGWLALIGASHLAADMITEDLRAPYGIPALWPFSSERFIAPFHVFLHLRKREWSDIVQWHNVFAVLWEAAIALPLVLAVLWWKTRAAGHAMRRPE